MAGKDQSRPEGDSAAEWTEVTEPIAGDDAGTGIVETELDLSGVARKPSAANGPAGETTASGLAEETVVLPTGPGKQPVAATPASAAERRGSKLAERNRAHREAVAAQERAQAPVVLRAERDEELDRRGVKLATVLIAIAVVLAAVAAVLAYQPGISKSDNEAFVDTSATSELIGQANDMVCVPFAYDYQKYDEWAARAKASLTGAAAKQYTDFIDTIREQTLQAKSTSECKAEWVGVMDLEGDSAEVLAQLIISQTTNGQIAGSMTPRAQFHFVKVDGNWKIGEVSDF